MAIFCQSRRILRPVLSSSSVRADHCDLRLELSNDQKYSILHTAAVGLEYLHSQQVIHGDVHPGNILLDADRLIAKIADLSSARATSSGYSVSVTPNVAAYSAPERQHLPSTACDVWSFGVVAYEVLVGNRPDRLIEIVQKTGLFDCSRISEPALRGLVERALSRDWDGRPKIGEFSATLAGFVKVPAKSALQGKVVQDPRLVKEVEDLRRKVDALQKEKVKTSGEMARMQSELADLSAGQVPPGSLLGMYLPAFRSWLGGAKNPKLLWLCTSNTFDREVFHANCDGHTPTITIVESDSGSIFGGFTPLDWRFHGTYGTPDPSLRSFVFALKSPRVRTPTRFPLQRGENDDDEDGPLALGHWRGSGGPPYFHDAFFVEGSRGWTSCGGSWKGLDDATILNGDTKFSLARLELWLWR